MTNNAVATQQGKILGKLLAFAAAVALTAGVTAQNVPMDQLPPQAFTMALNQRTAVDPKTTVGKLDNGITYYVRENKEPKNRAELRLVINAGSLQEDDNQLGLAHVLEHMAFNGTEHFPKQDLVHYMESIGMRLGSDLNASTSFDETIYQLQVPTDKPELLNTALQIMDDWSHSLLLQTADIDQERGVVAEEWRLGQGAQNRVRDKLLPVVLKDSRYAIRMPIGTLDSIQNFDPKVLKQFYQDWYRPELMAVIAVGDFDKTEVEKLIRQHFSTVPASKKNVRERKRFDVPAQSGTQFAIITDPELPSTSLAIYHKLPAITDWTPGGMRTRMVESFYNTLLSTRFAEIARQPNAPFLGAGSGRSSLVRTASAYQLAAAVQEGGVKRGLEALLVEAERVKRFGFTQAEFDRARTNMQRSIEQSWATRANRTSGSHAAEMVRAYLTGESMPGAEFEIALRIRFLNTITLDEVNQIGKDWIKDSNRAVVVTMPQKAGLVPPTEAELQEILANAAKADIKPYEDKTNNAPLVSSVPKGSPVVNTRTLQGDITEWTLGNGVKVVFKVTDYKKDEIVFNSVRLGGTSLASDADYIPASTAVNVIAGGGLGNFTAIDLQRKLTGKVARATPYFSDYVEGVSGSASPADLETMMQLIYLDFTAPRADANYFQVFQTQMTAALQNRLSSPETVFGDALTKLMYQNHPRRQPQTLETLKQTDLAKSLAFYQERFRDANGFTFVFAGSIDVKTFQPLVETWLGGLPASGRKDSWKDVGIRYAKGVKDETVRSGKEPKATTRIIYSGTLDSTDIQERLRIGAMAEILQNRLREVLREQLSGTYGVNVGATTNFRPDKSYALNISFGSAPERVDELVNAIYAEIDKMKQSGPTDTELANQKTSMLRSHETSLRQNGTWVAQLVFAYTNDISNGVEDFLNYDSNVGKLTADGLRDAFRRYFTNDNRIRASLLPEK